MVFYLDVVQAGVLGADAARITAISGLSTINGQSVSTFGGGPQTRARFVLEETAPGDGLTFNADALPASIPLTSTGSGVAGPFITDSLSNITFVDGDSYFESNVDADYQISYEVKAHIPEPDGVDPPTTDSQMVVRLLEVGQLFTATPIHETSCQYQPSNTLPGELFTSNWGTFSCSGSTMVRLSAGDQIGLRIWASLTTGRITLDTSTHMTVRLAGLN